MANNGCSFEWKRNRRKKSIFIEIVLSLIISNIIHNVEQKIQQIIVLTPKHILMFE